jgi:hypothetical protein
MNPRWNPVTIMILGTLLTVFAYVTSLFFVSSAFEVTLALMLTAFGILTLASGVVLSYLQFYRDEPRGPGRRF